MNNRCFSIKSVPKDLPICVWLRQGENSFWGLVGVGDQDRVLQRKAEQQSANL